MTALLTLPALASTAFTGMDQTIRALRCGVTPDVRGRAANGLRRALRRGRISAMQAEQALVGGETAIAALLRPLTVELPLPKLDPHTVGDLPVHAGWSRERLQQVLAIARRLVADGDVPLDNLQRHADGSPDPSGLAVTVMEGWRHRCNRLSAMVVPTGGLSADVPRYAVSLVPLVDALDDLMASQHSTMGSLEERLAGGVLCELVEYPLVRLPAHPVHQPAFFKAFTAVWEALEGLFTSPLMARLDATLMDLTGGYGEDLTDAIATATWDGDVPSFSSAVAQSLQDSFDLDPNEHTESFVELRRWQEAAQVRPYGLRSKAFANWLSQAPAGQRTLLERLMQITSQLQRATQHLPKPAARNFQGYGILAVALVPSDYGFDDMLSGVIDSMYEGGEPPTWQAEPDNAQNLDQVFGLADRMILEASAATAAIHLLNT